jgi:hypothetical protein
VVRTAAAVVVQVLAYPRVPVLGCIFAGTLWWARPSSGWELDRLSIGALRRLTARTRQKSQEYPYYLHPRGGLPP